MHHINTYALCAGGGHVGAILGALPGAQNGARVVRHQCVLGIGVYPGLGSTKPQVSTWVAYIRGLSLYGF